MEDNLDYATEFFAELLIEVIDHHALLRMRTGKVQTVYLLLIDGESGKNIGGKKLESEIHRENFVFFNRISEYS